MASLSRASPLLLLSFLSAASFSAAEPLQVGFKRTVVDASQDLALVRRQTSDTVSATLNNAQNRTLYTIDVSIGTPPQKLSLQLDTGSSDLWVPATGSSSCNQEGCPAGSYDPDSSSSFTNLTDVGPIFNISYDSPGDFDAGYYFSDTITFGGATLQNITIGLATQDVDNTGLMGVGAQALESIVGNEESKNGYPTVVGALVEAGIIEREAFSLWLNDLDATSGTILFGGVDTAKYTGDLIGLPIQLDAQAGIYDRYLVTLSSVSIKDEAGTRLLSDSNLDVAALLDSGTTNMVLPDNVAQAIWGGLGAAQEGINEITVPCNLKAANASLLFGFGGPGGPSISVPVSELIDGSLFANVDYSNGEAVCALGVNTVADDPSGSIILGDAFLRSAYVVYDLANQQIAIANTNYNATSSNIVALPSGTSIPGVSSFATAGAPTAVPTALGPAVPTMVTGAAPTNPGTPTFSLGPIPTSAAPGASSSKGAAAAAATPFAGLQMLLGAGAAVAGVAMAL